MGAFGEGIFSDFADEERPLADDDGGEGDAVGFVVDQTVGGEGGFGLLALSNVVDCEFNVTNGDNLGLRLGSPLGSCLFKLLFEVALGFDLLFDGVNEVLGGGLEFVGGFFEQVRLFENPLVSAFAGEGLDSADAASGAGLAHDFEEADFAGGADVDAAAEFPAKAGLVGRLGADLDHAHGVSVLLAEESHRAHRLCVVDGEVIVDDNREVFEGLLVDDLFDLGLLLFGHGRAVGEVEAQTIWTDIGTGLSDVLAEDLAQGSVEQVGGGVVADDTGSASVVHFRLDDEVEKLLRLGHGHLDGFYFVNVNALLLDDAGDSALEAASGEGSVVADLATGLGIEGGLDEGDHEGRVVLSVLVAREVPEGHGGGDFGLGLGGVVTDELGGGWSLPLFGLFDLGKEVNDDGAADASVNGVAILAASGAILRLFQGGFVASFVDFDARFGAEFSGDFEGESVGVVELESELAQEHLGALRLESFQLVLEHFGTGGDGAAEKSFFVAKGFDDDGLALDEFFVVAAHGFQDAFVDSVEKGFAETENALALQDGAADEPSQDIASTGVAGEDAIGDAEARGPDVVGDDPGGVVLGRVGAVGVGVGGDLLDLFDDGGEGVGVVDALVATEDGGGSFQAHSGVDAVEGEVGHAGLFVSVAGAIEVTELALPFELDEDIVPDFQPVLRVIVLQPVLGGVGAGGRRGFGDPVEHFRVGAAGAGRAGGEGSGGPVVGFFAEAEDADGGIDAGFSEVFAPALEREIVLVEDGEGEAVLVEAKPLGRGQEFPGEGDGFFFEVVPKTEVAEHLEEGEVAEIADVFDVTGSNALLGVGQAFLRGLGDAAEERLELDHSGAVEQETLVEATGYVVRHQRA